MTLKTSKHLPIKFYQEDIVQRITSPNAYGIVMRCWHDSEDPPHTNSHMDPLMRPLQRGEIGVSFFPSLVREISPESDFRLVDRSFHPGDFCKKSIDDVRSGVVTSIEVKGRLKHVINDIPVDGWRSIQELESPTDVEIADYVVYDDWIGQIIELFDEAVVEISNGQLVRLPELSSRLSVGDKGNDILPPPGHSLFGFLIGSHRTEIDTVIAVRHTILAISWLAINQSLDPHQAETRKRPQRFWSGEDLGKLTLVKGKSEQDMRVGDKFLFKDPTGLPKTLHGQEEGLIGSHGLMEVQTFVVTETQTTVNVLWQDGTQEMLPSTELIPYLNPDEYDCWPGDHVIWKGEDETRPAIVQSVNASDRTAAILYPDTGLIELASVLELDAHGTSDVSATDSPSASEGLGVRRGDFVFIHREGTTNGLEKPRVPRIGEVETWVREALVSPDGQLDGWRKEMSELGADIAAKRGFNGVDEGQIKHFMNGDGALTWFGEVTGLRLDGAVEVQHPDLSIVVYPLERLTKLYDGIEQLEDDMWEDDERDSYDDGEEVWSMDHDGVWQPHNNLADNDEWEEMDDTGDDGMDVDLPGWADEQALSPIEPSSYASFTPPISAPSTTINGTSSPATPLQSLNPPDVRQGDSTELDDGSDGDGSHWKRFDVLPSAPTDHAFYSSTPAQPSKSFLGRLTREYRVLASSLPESIIVRTYEDRSDLMRSLIIGPENTPYEDAPFVIDWMLDSNFPNSPPIAHFLSWTNGNGRVNPNLYEEGKVCLSILGTWAGDRNEIWSSARSSLLQAFVSIQGLVLVKEPWFCEPAYEKLRGTEDGKVNSRLYNEKAYVLSRGFVRRALEIPLGGLESEINWMYYTNKRLAKVVNDARVLVEKSRTTSSQEDVDQDVAVPRLTAGGIITLGRALSKLQILLESRQTI